MTATSEGWSVAISTLGCRLNQVESQEMLALLASRGFRVVSPDDPADVHVVNTCTVTGRADFSDRQAIRRIGRERPNALLVVTGCYAQTDAAAVAAIPGVDLVVGNQEKYRLPALLAPLLERARGPRSSGPASSTGTPPAAPTAIPIHVAPIGQARSVPVAPFARVTGRSRAFVKVQDGCQHRCAFCIVPAARGASRSQDPEVVLEQIRALVAEGYREVTLTGVDMGHYGWDLQPRTTLASLIARIADIRGLCWLRLSSILPAYFTPALLDVVVGSRIVVPHFHVPLQSGSDRVLRLMRRPHNTRMYRSLVERLARDVAQLGLGADVIVGHPGERDDDFRDTVDLVRVLPFSYLHVFSYSDRKGTEAAGLPERVPSALIADRSRALRALGREKSLAFRRGLVGRRHQTLVLAERDRTTGLLTGLTSNYVEVLFAGPETLARQLVPVRVTDADLARTFGELEERSA